MTMRVLSLGACQLTAPINSLVRDAKIQDSWILSRKATVTCYCVGDALQVLRLSRGQMNLDEGMRYFFGLAGSAEEAVGNAQLDDADIALIDCNTPVAMCVDGIFINRSAITREIYQPLAAANPELGKAYDIWWHKGIFGGDEELKRSAAMALIPSLQGVVKNHEVAATILLEMRAVRQSQDELNRSLDELRGELAMPFGMVTSIYRYLPDGRPIGWPPRHLEMTKSAASELGIPIFDTVSLVQRHGVTSAMNEDLTNYRQDFLPKVGDAFLAFMNEVLDGTIRRKLS